MIPVTQYTPIRRIGITGVTLTTTVKAVVALGARTLFTRSRFVIRTHMTNVIVHWIWTFGCGFGGCRGLQPRVLFRRIAGVNIAIFVVLLGRVPFNFTHLTCGFGEVTNEKTMAQGR